MFYLEVNISDYDEHSTLLSIKFILNYFPSSIPVFCDVRSQEGATFIATAVNASNKKKKTPWH
jgi:hypothetical protein